MSSMFFSSLTFINYMQKKTTDNMNRWPELDVVALLNTQLKILSEFLVVQNNLMPP